MQVTKFKKAPLAAGIALAVGVPFPYGFAVAEEKRLKGQSSRACFVSAAS